MKIESIKRIWDFKIHILAVVLITIGIVFVSIFAYIMFGIEDFGTEEKVIDADIHNAEAKTMTMDGAIMSRIGFTSCTIVQRKMD